MIKIAVVCAPGVGDAVIMHLVSHQLTQNGFEVIIDTPHCFGSWLPNQRIGSPIDCDAIFLQHDNSPKAKQLHRLPLPVYTFYGSHQLNKHGPLRPGFDYVCDKNRTMVDNLVSALQTLFGIQATKENGFTPPVGLIHRKYMRRVAIHTSSGHPDKNWPVEKYRKIATWLEGQGFEPVILPQFASLEELTSFIYESGFFIGNDSGPGHIASYLQIPHLIIGQNEKLLRLWRPGWGFGQIVTPPSWIPNWKFLRLKEKKWKSLITIRKVTKILKNKILRN